MVDLLPTSLMGWFILGLVVGLITGFVQAYHFLRR